MTKVVLALVLCLFTAFAFADNKMSCVKSEVVYKNKSEVFVLYGFKYSKRGSDYKKIKCTGKDFSYSEQNIPISTLKAGEFEGEEIRRWSVHFVSDPGFSVEGLTLITKKYKGSIFNNCGSISSKSFACG